MMEPGAIFFSNNKKGIFPALIRFFTGSKISHSGIIFFPVGANETVIEAGQLVQVVPFARHYELDSAKQYWVYRLKTASPGKMTSALAKTFYTYAGKKYGYAQLLWFIYRWFCEKIGVDVRKGKNWFPSGKICSELQFDYLASIGGEHKEILSGFLRNTINAEDLLKIVESRSDLFELVKEKV